MQYLQQQIRRFGSDRLGLAAYNAGPENVARGIMPQETQDYLTKILGEGSDSQSMVMDLIKQIRDNIASLEAQAEEERARSEADYNTAGQKLAASDADIANQIRNTPTQSDRPRWQQGIAAILGGGTEAALQNEVKGAQQIHHDLLLRSIEQNGRLADAYLKMGDLVNGNKYTKIAQQLAKERANLVSAQELAIKGATDKEVAAIQAGGRRGPQPKENYLTPAEFQKQWNDTVTSFTDKNKTIPETAKPALKASLVMLRHANQTPLSWAQNLFGAIPGKKQTGLGGFLGFGAKGEAPLFNKYDESDWNLLKNAGHLFTAEELANPETGEAALEKWHDSLVKQGPPPAANTPTASQPEEPAVVTLRKEAVDITRQLADMRRAAGGPLAEARKQQVDSLVERLKLIKTILKLHGMELITPQIQIPGTEVQATR